MTGRIVIHAGLPKCGSTSLQLRLAAARDALAAAGIAYPLADRTTGRLVFGPAVDPWRPEHMALAQSLAEASAAGEGPPALLTAALAAWAAGGAATLVLSSESFGPRARNYAAAVLAPLREHRVHAVSFTRRRDDWMLAMYKQSLRTWARRHRGGFRRWLDTPPPADAHLAGLSASGAAARLAALTGGTAEVLDLEPPDPGGTRRDTGALFGRVLGWPLERGPDWMPERLGTLRGAERRAGLPVNASHSDAAALFLAMVPRHALDRAGLLQVAAAAAEHGFGGAAPPVCLMDEALSAALLAGGAAERAALGLSAPEPRAAAPGTERRDTLTVAEWRAMAAALAFRLEPAVAGALARADVAEIA